MIIRISVTSIAGVVIVALATVGRDCSVRNEGLARFQVQALLLCLKVTDRLGGISL